MDPLHLKGMQAEEFVTTLAKKTFFEDWCYPNPSLPNGKELCDLLVVFDQVAVVWQVKDLKIQSGRCKPRHVDKNLRQLAGARRTLHTLRRPFPLVNPRRGSEVFEPDAIREIFLISALLGEPQFSLPLLARAGEAAVHVFDREFTEIALGELDTVADFVGYLRSKEAHLAGVNDVLVVGGEKQLLAFYLLNDRSLERLSKPQIALVDDTHWETLVDMPACRAKKEHDAISYEIWDHFVDIAHDCGPEYEPVARELARPDRFTRRCLSNIFYDRLMELQSEPRKGSFRRVTAIGDRTYCFVFEDEEYSRDHRKAVLWLTCSRARLRYPHNRRVIGIATEREIGKGRSFDFSLLDLPEWTEEDQAHVEGEAGLVAHIDQQGFSSMREDEYPG